MPAIELTNLSKTFRVKVRGEGFKHAVASVFKPVYKPVKAVKCVNLSVEQGEMLAFIGPNGAGKSTTIKMLTGILHPTSGSAKVLGLDPVRERRRLSYRIGAVFGQKSQLSFHLPPTDSFRLLCDVYEVDRNTYRERLGRLVELLELGEFLDTPVRKLSLGQRVRCEFAASLLHAPEILFLDEPTIGLDVVVKQQIRELITRLNREENVTVFLTSHDAGDVESLCRRAVVIDRGSVALDIPVKKLKYDYLNKKVVSLKFTQAAQLPEIDGVTVVKSSPYTVKLNIDTRTTPVARVLAALSADNIADITITDPPMEEIIAAIYTNRREDGA